MGDRRVKQWQGDKTRWREDKRERKNKGLKTEDIEARR